MNWIFELFGMFWNFIGNWSGQFTVISVFLAWFTLRCSRKNQREDREILHQPNFDIVDFNCEVCGTIKTNSDSRPRHCCNPDCSKIHWFNIVNRLSSLAATNLHAGLFIVDNDDICYNRANWIAANYLAGGGSLQYSLPEDNICFSRYFDKNRDRQYKFYLLLDYRSELLETRYKRAYIIEATAICNDDKSDNSHSDIESASDSWTTSIQYFDVEEYGKTSKKTASKKARLLAFVHRHLNAKFNVDDWLNDFSKKGRKYE